MLADNLILLRGLKGLTQEQAAEIAGVRGSPTPNGSRAKPCRTLKNATALQGTTA